jgi:hypothetical protein
MYLLPGGAAGLLRRLRRVLVEVVEAPAAAPSAEETVMEAGAVSSPQGGRLPAV